MEPAMTVFATLLLGHLIADFPLQSNTIFKFKTRSFAGLLLHVGVHLLILSLLIIEPWRFWPVFLFLGVTHFIIDWVKVRWHSSPAWPGFVLDQIAHMAVLVMIALWQPDMAIRPMPSWLLGVGLIGAMLSALAMFGWVLMNDLQPKREKTGRQPDRTKDPMFQVSQRGGRILVFSLALVWILI